MGLHNLMHPTDSSARATTLDLESVNKMPELVGFLSSNPYQLKHFDRLASTRSTQDPSRLIPAPLLEPSPLFLEPVVNYAGRKKLMQSQFD